MNKIRIYIASDHAGYELKQKILALLSHKFDFLDFGTHSKNACNYNDIAAKTLSEFEKSLPDNASEDINVFSVLICASGAGMSMIANKFTKIRALLCQNIAQIEPSRQHNNANTLCLGQSFTNISDAVTCIEKFIDVNFEGGRHSKRLQLNNIKKYINLDYIGQIDENYTQINYKIKNFPCGETEFSINEDIFDQEVHIFQSFSRKKFNENLMKLLIICDVLKRNNVKSIKLFAPFLPYTRQDKTYDMRTSLGSKLMADLINYARINEITTYDLHAPQIEGFFANKIQHLSMIPEFLADIKSNFSEASTTIVFPDAGSAARFKDHISYYSFNIAIMNKNRVNIDSGSQINMSIIGNVSGQNCIIIDDMIDSGATLIEAANLLKSNGGNRILAYATHGIFSNNAILNLELSVIEKIIVSNSIDQDSKSDKLRIISIKN